MAALAAACSQLPLEDSARLDITPPELEVRAPMRGAMAGADKAVEVRGVAADHGAGIGELTVNGAPVAVAADGSFTARVPLVPGITLIQIRVVDLARNERSETRAVLSGDLVPLESTVADGVVVRLDRELLRVAGELAGRKLDALDLEKQIKNHNPLFNSGVKCLSARVEVLGLSKGPASFSLRPVVGGLELDASVADLSASVHVKYDVACHTGEGDIVLTARRFRLAGPLGLSIGADGRAALDASQLTAAFEAFDWGGDLLSAGVRDFLEEPLAETFAAVLAGELQKRLPELVADRLGGQTDVITVGDKELSVSLRPAQIRVDERGILLALDTRIFVYGSVGAVFPRSPAPRPDLDRAPRALGVGISDDALNQVLSSLWGAGLLDREISVPTEKFQKYGVTVNHVTIASRLPPVAEALPDGRGLRITVGDLEALFELRQPGRVPLFVGRLAVSLRADFQVRVANNRLSVVAGKPELSIDVLREQSQVAHSFNEDSLRALADFATEVLVGVLDDAVSDVPIPAVQGMQVVAGEATTATAGYLLVRGDVAPL